MNARELHAKYANRQISELEFDGEEHRAILRALALLASVEESGDELVRELQSIYKWCSPQYSDPMKKVAAALVALRERVEQYELGTVPAGALILTGSADAQGNRVEWKVKGEKP